MESPLTFVSLGCGARADAYFSIALGEPERHQLVAVADPVEARRRRIAALESAAAVREFAPAEGRLERARLAAVALVATQDRQHFGHARRALEVGYDLLLEKPAAATAGEVEALHQLARQLGRKVVLCFVLRYTPFYRRVKEVIDSGRLGEVLAVDLVEGVGTWHFGHSFVRGHWAIAAESTPMLVAKCCHDADLLHWFLGSRSKHVFSRKRLGHFHAGRAPEGAPARCTDGCPVAASCPYDAHRYAGDQRDPWLAQVMTGAAEADEASIHEWLAQGPWGRCVYRCDNDAPDHQVVTVEFESGAIGTLTMTAFDSGRRIRVFGTRGLLSGGLHVDGVESVLRITDHDSGKPESLDLPVDSGASDYSGHGGGDGGLVATLYPTFREVGDPAGWAALLDEAVEGHRIAFAAG